MQILYDSDPSLRENCYDPDKTSGGNPTFELPDYIWLVGPTPAEIIKYKVSTDTIRPKCNGILIDESKLAALCVIAGSNGKRFSSARKTIVGLFLGTEDL